MLKWWNRVKARERRKAIEKSLAQCAHEVSEYLKRGDLVSAKVKYDWWYERLVDRFGPRWADFLIDEAVKEPVG